MTSLWFKWLVTYYGKQTSMRKILIFKPYRYYITNYSLNNWNIFKIVLLTASKCTIIIYSSLCNKFGKSFNVVYLFFLVYIFFALPRKANRFELWWCAQACDKIVWFHCDETNLNIAEVESLGRVIFIKNRIHKVPLGRIDQWLNDIFASVSPILLVPTVLL